MLEKKIKSSFVNFDPRNEQVKQFLETCIPKMSAKLLKNICQGICFLVNF